MMIYQKNNFFQNYNDDDVFKFPRRKFIYKDGKKFCMKISVGIWAFGVTVDRVTTDGYKDPVPIEKQFELASKVDGIEGVELHYPTQFVDGDIKKTKEVLEKYGLKCSNVMVDCYLREWQNGGIISYDDKLWRKFIDRCKRAVDAAVELGTDQIGICPTHDGFDYPFQAYFPESFDRFVKGIREIARYNPDIKVGIEYKPRETRAYIITRSVDRAIVLAKEVGEKNVGIIMDVGHALFGQENLAESAYVAMRHGMLYHLHLNDNHAIWDDDMIYGTINFWHHLELLVWLKHLGYDRWYSFDIYPYREDPVRATEECVRCLRIMSKLADKIDLNKLKELQLSYRTPDIVREVWSSVFGE